MNHVMISAGVIEMWQVDLEVWNVCVLSSKSVV